MALAILTIAIAIAGNADGRFATKALVFLLVRGLMLLGWWMEFRPCSEPSSPRTMRRGSRRKQKVSRGGSRGWGSRWTRGGCIRSWGGT